MRRAVQSYTILYFLDYAKSFGGAAKALLQQAILMKKAGHRVVLFFSDYFGDEMEKGCKRIYQNLKIEWRWATYQISSQPEDIDVVCLDRNYNKFQEEIASYTPDILHSVQMNPEVELVSRELKIPHIMNIYPLIPDFFAADYLNIFPHYHLCDSWYYARKWAHYLQTDSSCIRTVVNRKSKRSVVINDQMINFICVGTIYKEKNQLAVIKAFHKALQNGIEGRLTICGAIIDGYLDCCLKYIVDHNLEEKIFVKGFCTDMQTEYSASDVLICGSTRESYPNVISEALANGLIIISTPVGGIPEVIEDGVNGYLTEDYSENALFEKIIECHKDLKTGKVRRILENAEKSFQEHHSPLKVTGQLVQYYQHVLDDYNKREKIDDHTVIGITDIRNKFSEMLKKFNENEKYFTEPKKIALKLWYLYYTEKEIKSAFFKKSEFYIWGTGKYGVIVKELVDVFLPKIQISGFLDSKKEGIYLGHNIYNPDEIIKKENVVVFIAAVNGQDEMIEKLKSVKKVFNKDYFILSPRRW